MPKEVIEITGNFKVKWSRFKNVKQPLKKLKIKMYYPPIVHIESFTSLKSKK